MQRTLTLLGLAAALASSPSAASAQAPQCADVHVHAECHLDATTQTTTLVLTTESVRPPPSLQVPAVLQLRPPLVAQKPLRLVRLPHSNWAFPAIGSSLAMASIITWTAAAEADSSGYDFDPVRTVRTAATMLTMGAISMILAAIIRGARNRQRARTVLEF